jgi:hypothetical protein
MQRGESEHGRASERRTDDQGRSFDTEVIEYGATTSCDIFDRDVWKSVAVPSARHGINRGRSARAKAATHRIHADDVVVIRIESCVLANELFPPANAACAEGERPVKISIELLFV